VLALQLESVPITADLTTTVVHTCSYKSLINDVKPVHSLTLLLLIMSKIPVLSRNYSQLYCLVPTMYRYTMYINYTTVIVLLQISLLAITCLSVLKFSLYHQKITLKLNKKGLLELVSSKY